MIRVLTLKDIRAITAEKNLVLPQAQWSSLVDIIMWSTIFSFTYKDNHVFLSSASSVYTIDGSGTVHKDRLNLINNK